MKGIINLYKPKGITCFHAVACVRKALGTKAVGHMGTLDPAGEGVLPIGVGKATRLFDYYLSKDKVYEAEFAFGYETDTLDGEGAVLERCEHIPTLEEIKAVLGEFIGKNSQMPPKYSAKNINGARAYDLARAGKDFDLKPSDIIIYHLEAQKKTNDHTYLMSVHCSAGTYVRSICRDLALRLGTKATMTSIKRISSGSFKIENSVSIDDLFLNGASCLVSVEDALSDLPRLNVEDSFYKDLCDGKKLPCTLKDKFTVYCKDELFGIGTTVEGILKIKTYLKD